VHPDVTALLAVQDEDVAIHQLEQRLAELKPRLAALAKSRDDALTALKKAEGTAETEERRRQEIAARVAQHRAQQAKNEATLSSVTSMREATAATAQLEQTKRMIDEGERSATLRSRRAFQCNARAAPAVPKRAESAVALTALSIARGWQLARGMRAVSSRTAHGDHLLEPDRRPTEKRSLIDVSPARSSLLAPAAPPQLTSTGSPKARETARSNLPVNFTD